MSNKKPLVTRETYRRERDKQRWQGRLREALGWDHETKDENKQPTVSQTTQMFSLKPDQLLKRHQEKSGSTVNTRRSTTSTENKTEATSKEKRHMHRASGAMGEQVASKANESKLEPSAFWEIKTGKIDRFLNWGIILLAIGIVLVTLIALYI
ncbi:MAG: hypothetical protein Q4A67_02130 [Aerococcus sp.]|nr:hypothetical protein [Aerococcus sp.]